MAKRKKDPTTIGLQSSQVEGQGTTNEERGVKEDSSKKKQKRF